MVLVEMRPPQPGDFTVVRQGRSGSLVEWRPYGAVIRSAMGSGTNPIVLAHNAVLPDVFDVVVGLVWDGSHTGDQHHGGVCLLSSTQDTAVSFDIMNIGLAIRYYYLNFMLEGRVALRSYNVSPGVLLFMRIVQDGTKRRFYVGSNGKDWVLFFERPIEHTTEDLRFGVLVDARNAETDFIVHFVHWSVS